MKEMDSGKINKSAYDHLASLFARIVAHVKTPLFKNGYALALSAGLSSLLGLLFWVLVARFYPAGTVGINSAVLSAMLLLSGIAQLGLNSVLVRFIPVAASTAPRLIASAYLASVVATAATVLIFALGASLWAPSLRLLIEQPRFLLTFTAASIIWSIFSLQDSVLTGLRRAVWVPIENTIFSVMKIVLLILFAGTFQLYGIFAAWMLPVAILIIPVNLLIFKRLLPRYLVENGDENPDQIPSLRWIARYTAGNYIGTLFTLLSATLLPLLVFERLGADQNAYFYLPWTMTTSLLLLGQNMTISLVVEAARDQEKLSEYGHRILVHSLRLLLPIVAVLVFGAPLILRIFGSVYSEEGSQLLRLLSLAVIPNLVIVLYIGTQGSKIT
jgi:O-antigen/teichoic acid export membrane protein